jgi:hypothetical protein
LRLDFEKGPIHPSPLGPSVLTPTTRRNLGDQKIDWPSRHLGSPHSSSLTTVAE